MYYQDLRSSINLTYLVYALQALGLFTAIGFIVGIFINYIKRNDLRDTWLASHFSWQIRTFWYGLLWSALGGILVIVFIGWAILAITYIWVIYRIVKGFIYLNERREI